MCIDLLLEILLAFACDTSILYIYRVWSLCDTKVERERENFLLWGITISPFIYICCITLLSWSSRIYSSYPRNLYWQILGSRYASYIMLYLLYYSVFGTVGAFSWLIGCWIGVCSVSTIAIFCRNRCVLLLFTRYFF